MSKSTSKSGSRISQVTEQLEKLVAVDKSARDMEQLRYVTLKMCQLLQTQDKGKKEILSKICEKAAVLLSLLEGCSDTQLILNILGCFLELSAGGKKSVAMLAAHGAVDVLLKILKIEISEPSVMEETLVLVHSILARIAPKDRKFALKSRLTGSLQITMDVIKQNANNFKVLHPALLVIKLCAGSSVNCSVLNKAGFINILFRILSNCGHKRVTTLKLVLDLIAILVKSKGVAVKAVNLNGVEILLRMFYDWHRTDHHNRQTAIRKALLNSLKALVSTKAGKAAFLQSDGMKTLFVLANDTGEHKELNSINGVIVQILRLCMPENTLPLTNKHSTLSFELPKCIVQSTSGDDNGSDEVEKDSDEEESSPLESEDEDVGVTESQDDSENVLQRRASPPLAENKSNNTRSKADLVSMYHQFFQEMNCTKDESGSTDISPSIQTPIVIPTANLDLTSSFGNWSNAATTCEDCCACDETENWRQDGLCDVDDTLLRDSERSALMSPSCSTSSTEIQSCATSRTCDESRYLGRDSTHDQKMKVRSVSEFVKTPLPDVYGHYPPLHPEPLHTKKPGIQRSMLLKDIERVLQDQKVVNIVVYDLDTERNVAMTSNREYSATDLSRDSTSSTQQDKERQTSGKRPLSFESKFECGNLRKAIQVCEREYDLILNSDVNCSSHHQWFYFEVSNMEENVPYKFNIINSEKINSQFNFGMQPLLYSCKDAEDGDPGWIRTGSDICYYKNHYKRPCSNPKTEREKYYYTLTFTIEFPYSNDCCYLAYHYPYSFSLLENHLLTYEYRLDPNKILYKRQVLCDTLTGNPCYVITITSPNCSHDNRPYIFLCSRVHPGESNASWVMKGVLDFLLSSKITARVLREIYIFKIIPMLNPDGVINGCHRCSLSGADLNRQWLDPDPILFPTIYHAKGLLLHLQAMNKKPLIFCDFHGHSRKKNVFMYGCHNPTVDLPVTIVTSGSESDSSNVGEAVKETNYRTLPRILHSIAPSFSFQNCSFVVESSKESTARVVVWRELGVTRSYTMESTYCGTDQGPYKGFHIGTKELEEMGRCFCAGLLKLGNSSSITALLGTIPKLSMDELEADDDILLRDGDLFAPVDTYPYEGREYATQLLV